MVPYIKCNDAKSSEPVERIHSDECEANDPCSWNQKRYILSIANDFTYFAILYLISTKDMVLQFFKKFVMINNTLFGKLFWSK